MLSKCYEQYQPVKKLKLLFISMLIVGCQQTLDHNSTAYKTAVDYFDSNKFDSTVAILERQTIRFSDSALLVLGIAHYQLGNTETALNYLKTAIELNSKFEIGYYNIGLIYDYENKTELALENYDRAIEIDPNSKSPIYNKAAIYFKQNKLIESFKLAKRAIEIDSSYSLPYHLISQVYTALNKLDSALLFNRKLVTVDPTKAEYWFYLGISEEDNGNRTDAIEAYSRSIQLAPESTPSYFNRATLHQRNGNSELAKKDYIQLTKLAPTEMVNYIRLSWIYSSENKLDSTRTILEKAITIDSTFSEAYFYLGDHYYQMKKTFKACELYQKASELNNQRATERFSNRCNNGENKSS